ncbi:MAG: hypothetical protein BV459_05655 [Thermoplasmata archaeon M11B2D]|nr:MAG: hypothetical protein BV459_05655 [Thermoplasmata archaeon M11B2D]
MITKNVRPATDDRFMIFGERNSGTNYIQKLIEKNFCKCFANLIIWKHWMGFVGTQKPYDSRHVLTVGIIRDPIDWLSSMKACAPHASHMSALEWVDFVQSEWWSIHDNPSYGYEIMEDRDFDTKERYANILKLRSKKLSWLLDPPINSPYILVKYENLRFNMPGVMRLIGEIFGLEMPKTFINITQDLSRGGEYQEHTYPQPTPEALDIIRSQLDWDLEAQVGYKMI